MSRGDQDRAELAARLQMSPHGLLRRDDAARELGLAYATLGREADSLPGFYQRVLKGRGGPTWYRADWLEAHLQAKVAGQRCREPHGPQAWPPALDLPVADAGRFAILLNDWQYAELERRREDVIARGLTMADEAFGALFLAVRFREDDAGIEAKAREVAVGHELVISPAILSAMADTWEMVLEAEKTFRNERDLKTTVGEIVRRWSARR